MITEFPKFAGGACSRLRMILQDVLVQESRLAATTHNYVWRVRGSPLQSFKRLVAEQGRQIDRWVGELRECARIVGIATGATPIVGAPQPGDAPAAPPREVMADLLARHEAIVAELREALEDARERDPDGKPALVLGGLLEFHETSAWMLRLLLESPERARIV